MTPGVVYVLSLTVRVLRSIRVCLLCTCSCVCSVRAACFLYVLRPSCTYTSSVATTILHISGNGEDTTQFNTAFFTDCCNNWLLNTRNQIHCFIFLMNVYFRTKHAMPMEPTPSTVHILLLLSLITMIWFCPRKIRIPSLELGCHGPTNSRNRVVLKLWYSVPQKIILFLHRRQYPGQKHQPCIHIVYTQCL